MMILIFLPNVLGSTIIIINVPPCKSCYEAGVDKLELTVCCVGHLNHLKGTHFIICPI